MYEDNYSYFYPRQNPQTSNAVAPGTSGINTVPGEPSGVLSPFVMAPGSPVEQGTAYTQGYLRTLIGKKIRIEFLLGSNTMQDRVGILKEVGIDYVVIRESETDDDLLCDIYSIKFVTQYQ